MGKLKILALSFLLLSFILHSISNVKSPFCHIKKLSESKNFVSYKGENEYKLSHKCCKDKNEKKIKQIDCCSYNKTCCLNFSSPYALHQKELFQDLRSESLGLVSEIGREILSIKDKFQPPRQL
jgi:hypothetical protein